MPSSDTPDGVIGRRTVVVVEPAGLEERRLPEEVEEPGEGGELVALGGGSVLTARGPWSGVGRSLALSSDLVDQPVDDGLVRGEDPTPVEVADDQPPLLAGRRGQPVDRRSCSRRWSATSSPQPAGRARQLDLGQPELERVPGPARRRPVPAATTRAAVPTAWPRHEMSTGTSGPGRWCRGRRRPRRAARRGC